MKKIILFLFLVAAVNFVSAQEQFSVSVSASTISSVPGLHSGAFAKWSGKWIFIGGRIDGLHNFQAGQGFSVSSRNDSVFVVDPVNDQRWAASLTVLPHSMYEAICSSNMEYYQDDSTLYMIGGYGRSDSALTKITFPTLTAIDLEGLVNAVISYSAVDGYFRQVLDTNVAVTGGHLEKIDSTFYLVFGHRFDGQYDEHAGSVFFVQHYSNQIRKFKIADDGTNLSISDFQTVTDTTEFHRRDYNLVPQIFTNGEYGFTAFGGVFQKFANLPYLNPIDIRASSANVNSFSQNMNQYETASMPVHDSSTNFMHTIFFGGMSLYTYDTIMHVLVQDTLIPFVKTISKVTRDSAGVLTEYALPVQMPSLIGTDAHFIPDPGLALNHNSIIELNPLSAETHAGWIVGGIESDFPNIAHLDPDGMSRPSSIVYDVFIHKSMIGIKEQQIKSEINDLFVYPNPSHGIFNISFSVNQKLKVDAAIFNADGKKITTLVEGVIEKGEFNCSWNSSHSKQGIYFCRIKAAGYTKTVKLVVDR